MDEIIYASATELARAIRDRKVSSEEVTSAYLARIEEVNPKLNAVVQLTADAALTHARELDAALARGESRGHFCTASPSRSRMRSIWRASSRRVGRKGAWDTCRTEDATGVARLKAAGAIVLGKTNVPEISLAYESDNLVYGSRPKNPYDFARTPGGRAAAARRRRLLRGCRRSAWGATRAGGIRLPAHFCGIAGIKTDNRKNAAHRPLSAARRRR